MTAEWSVHAPRRSSTGRTPRRSLSCDVSYDVLSAVKRDDTATKHSLLSQCDQFTRPSTEMSGAIED